MKSNLASETESCSPDWDEISRATDLPANETAS